MSQRDLAARTRVARRRVAEPPSPGRCLRVALGDGRVDIAKLHLDAADDDPGNLALVVLLGFTGFISLILLLLDRPAAETWSKPDVWV